MLFYTVWGILYMIITGIPNWPHLQVNIVQEVSDTHAHTHIIYIYIYTDIQHMYACIYVSMYLCIHPSIHLFTSIHIYIYIYIHIYIYISIYIYMYIYIYCDWSVDYSRQSCTVMCIPSQLRPLRHFWLKGHTAYNR